MVALFLRALRSRLVEILILCAILIFVFNMVKYIGTDEPPQSAILSPESYHMDALKEMAPVLSQTRGPLISRAKPHRVRVNMENEISTILDNLSILGRRLIDLGAAVRDNDPCFALIDKGWDGLLIDGDPKQTAKWEHRFPGKTNGGDAKVKTVVTYILGSTIVDVLAENMYEKDVDLLKIDIDSFDCYVMEAILKAEIRPKVIVMEANVKHSPKVRTAMRPGYAQSGEEIWALKQIPYDSEQRGVLYGCSVAYQVHDVMQPYNYDIYCMDWNNVMYVDLNQVNLAPSEMSPQELVETWYNSGYWSRPNRDAAFKFNVNMVKYSKMDPVDTIASIQKNERFAKTHSGHHVTWNGVHYCFDSNAQLILGANCSIIL